ARAEQPAAAHIQPDPGAVPTPELGEGWIPRVRRNRLGVCRPHARRASDPRRHRRQADRAGSLLPREAAHPFGGDQGGAARAAADAASRQAHHAFVRGPVERTGGLRRLPGIGRAVAIAVARPIGRVLAVDPGSRRVGLAVSDPTGTIAQPLPTVDAEPQDNLPERLAGVARDRGAIRIIVGLPRRLDGSFGPEAKAARALADAVRKASRLPVELVDERLTTAQAE